MLWGQSQRPAGERLFSLGKKNPTELGKHTPIWGGGIAFKTEKNTYEGDSAGTGVRECEAEASAALLLMLSLVSW